MPNEVLQKTGTPVVWANSGDFSSTNSGFTRTKQLDLTSLANNAARQGDKADLGATRARRFAVVAGLQVNSAATAGNVIEIWWSSSASGTAGTGNTGGAGGSDAAYKAAKEDEWKQQLQYLGSLVLTNDGGTNVQYQCVGYFTPPDRYGMPVVVNKSGQALKNSGVEQFVALVPLIDEVQ